jgi:hypothetical protein
MSTHALPELLALERLIEGAPADLAVRRTCEVHVTTDGGQEKLPVYALTLGNPDPKVPAVGFFGGVHGLERIGTQVLLSFLDGLLARLRWDPMLHRQLESMRLVIMPIVNPGGMRAGRRSNPNGVDLMRNAPVEALARAPFLVGGQRISARLPWYRGLADGTMEQESRALCQVVEQELLGREFSVVLDCHSGFGLRDRIWFPYAHTPVPIQHLPEIHALKGLFDASYPHHDYIFEPQSRHYLAHGDLWDHLYQKSLAAGRGVFLPLTLEMGSWRWIKKRPSQLFTRLGIFNPLPAHRLQRVLRSHLVWLDFLSRVGCAWQHWLPEGAERARHQQAALRSWYPDLSGGRIMASAHA